MGSFSAVHWIIVALVAAMLFGPGRVSVAMGEFGKGIRSFRKGLNEGDAEQPKILEKSDMTGTANSPHSDE